MYAEQGPEPSSFSTARSVNVHLVVASFSLSSRNSNERAVGLNNGSAISSSIPTDLWRQHASQRTDRLHRDSSNCNLGYFLLRWPRPSRQSSRPDTTSLTSETQVVEVLLQLPASIISTGSQVILGRAET